MSRKTYLDKKGYYRYESTDELVHRAVMARHLGRPLTSEEIVDHINGVRTDNRLANLRLVPDRWSHAAASGLTVHGEKLPYWKPRPYKKGGRKRRYGVKDWRKGRSYVSNGGETARRRDPALWERVRAKFMRGSKGGRPGQWSARKAQLAVLEYKRRGGRYVGKKKRSNSLAKWTRQRWRTRSGKPSLQTGERYLPAKAIRSLSKREYAATTRAKRRGMRKGRQFVRQPKRIASKVKKFRRNAMNNTFEKHLIAAVSAILGAVALKSLIGDKMSRNADPIRERQERLSRDQLARLKDLEMLAKSPYESVRVNVVRHHRATPELIASLASDKDRQVRAAVAASPMVTLAAQGSLANDPSDGVRVALARNIHTDVSIKRRLSKDRERYVRVALAQNLSCDNEILRALQADYDSEVRSEAKITWAKKLRAER